MQNSVSFFQEGITLCGVDRTDEPDGGLINVRGNEIIEIILVLDYAGDDEVHACGFCNVDGDMNALVVVNAAVRDEFIAGFGTEGKVRQVNSVVDSGQVREFRVTVGIADGDKIAVLIFSIDRQNRR